jgi:hypothetical protein
VRPIDEVIEVFERWLILKDRTPLYVVFGAVAANRLEGDPVWLGLIAQAAGRWMPTGCDALRAEWLRASSMEHQHDAKVEPEIVTEVD